MARRSGLGRGLGALIPEDESVEGVALREVPVASIEPNPYQPRVHFDEETLTSLAESIEELGVLQPVLVRPLDEESFQLIAGERRWRAAQRAGLDEIPVIVRSIEDITRLEQAVVENLHRQDLNPLEEAAAYQQLIEDFGLTQVSLAGRVGRSRSAVANTLRLLQLPPPIQAHLIDGRLTAGHARALLGVEDADRRDALAAQAVEEELSVRRLEELAREPVAGDAETVDDAADDSPEPGSTRPAALLELEELLAEHLDTKVAVAMGARRGRITVQFADLDDLERLYKLITQTEG
ncbi:MAG: ParB/RepB/Spo0J family partition protein [Actinomycetota bacterium]